MTDDVKDFLAHHGVKGQKWGVINEERGGIGRNYLNALKQLRQDHVNATDKENAVAIAKSKEKFANKATMDGEKPPPPKTKGWRPSQGQVTAALVGGAFVGLYLYGTHINNKALAGSKINVEEIRALAGKPIEADMFRKAVGHSVGASWGLDGYIKESSFKQAAFTLPAGHEFHRIATSVETDFSSHTYSTHSIEDFNRYVAGFRQEKGQDAILHHVTFKANRPIKVSSLKDNLETLTEAMTKVHGVKPNELAVLAQYENMCGGSWKGQIHDEFTKGLLKKGFDAIVDDMDAGVIGESPLVVINPKAFGKKVTNVMDDSHIHEAESMLLEIGNRKFKGAK